MLGYLVAGALIGAVAGCLIPPGSLFWFAMGAVGAYVVNRYVDQQRY